MEPRGVVPWWRFVLAMVLRGKRVAILAPLDRGSGRWGVGSLVALGISGAVLSRYGAQLVVGVPSRHSSVAIRSLRARLGDRADIGMAFCRPTPGGLQDGAALAMHRSAGMRSFLIPARSERPAPAKQPSAPHADLAAVPARQAS